MTLISRKFSNAAKLISVTDRYVVVVVCDVIIINLYLPCAGSVDRLDLCEEILDNLCLLLSEYSNYRVILGGNLNVDLERVSCFDVS